MSQLTLFDSGNRVLADDERGRITYTPDFVDSETARAWFEELRSGVDWKGGRRMMYDREVDVPRLTGHYRLDTSESAPASTSSASVPNAILRAASRIAAHTGFNFNSVGLNLYRDGRDSVA